MLTDNGRQRHMWSAIRNVDDALKYLRDIRQIAPLHHQNDLARLEVILVDVAEKINNCEFQNAKEAREKIEQAVKVCKDFKFGHMWFRLNCASGELMWLIPDESEEGDEME